MPLPSKTGIKGLRFDEDGRARIDLRYLDPKTGQAARYKETLPEGTPRAEAKRRAQAVLSAALAGTLSPRSQAQPVRLSEAFDQYLLWVKTNKPKSHKQKTAIKNVWIETVGDVPIERFDSVLLEAYKTKRLEREVPPAAPATINKGLKTVRHMAKLAARLNWGWMDRERAAVLAEVELLEEPAGRQRPIKPAELTAILAQFKRADSRFARRVMQADLLTGCRMGELLGLDAADVDFRKKTIDIKKTKQNRNHQIVITPPLAALLKEALADEVRARAAAKGETAVFVNRFGRRYTVDGFSKHFGHVTERAGCGDITFHDLRRHVGTLLINKGERLEVVSKLLGHSTVAVTQRSYAHLSTDATRAAFGRLGEAFAFAPTKPRAKGVAPALPPAKKRAAAKRH